MTTTKTTTTTTQGNQLKPETRSSWPLSSPTLVGMCKPQNCCVGEHAEVTLL